ncbi:MAG: PKD domain-containing protein, partial [Bacteroidetes bacterium]|nr:PKD domain-containing protein [Bacteroidota bacterium]
MTRYYGILLLTFGLSHSLAAQCPITVDAGEDIYLCTPPTPTQLDGSISGDYLSFSWTPTAGLSGINTLTPTVNVTTNMTYVLTGNAANLNNNLIVNGDFGGGNYGFSSDYVYSPGDLVPEGYYDVIDNPQLDHPGFAPCEDHTGGGNMMAVNGAGSPNQDVWCQTVAVTPNTQYVFSAWVTTLVASSPAILQFSINGMTIGSVFNAPSTLCTWQNFFTTWNSGANTTADICIVNQNTVLGGNDFALDDLLFAPICKVTDTVKVFSINVKAVATAIYTIPCEGINITLDGTGSSTGPDITYQWDTGDGNIVSGANTLHPVVNQPGQYTLTVTFEKNGFIC